MRHKKELRMNPRIWFNQLHRWLCLFLRWEDQVGNLVGSVEGGDFFFLFLSFFSSLLSDLVGYDPYLGWQFRSSYGSVNCWETQLWPWEAELSLWPQNKLFKKSHKFLPLVSKGKRVNRSMYPLLAQSSGLVIHVRDIFSHVNHGRSYFNGDC